MLEETVYATVYNIMKNKDGDKALKIHINPIMRVHTYLEVEKSWDWILFVNRGITALI